MPRPFSTVSLLFTAGLLLSAAGCSTINNPAPSPSPDRSGDFSVVAIGDSLMVGARDQLADAHPGIIIDAKEGRSFSTGIDVLEARMATDDPDVVVFALGTNNGATADQIAAVIDIAGDVDEVIFVNVVVPRAWQSGTNLVMLEAAAVYDNVSFVDWHAASDGTAEFFRSDGYHLSATGIELWVDLIVAAAEKA